MSKFGNYLRTKAMKRRAKEEWKKGIYKIAKEISYDSMPKMSSGIK